MEGTQVLQLSGNPKYLTRIPYNLCIRITIIIIILDTLTSWENFENSFNIHMCKIESAKVPKHMTATKEALREVGLEAIVPF